MPGPIVVETVTDRMYVPFADCRLQPQQRLDHRARVVAQLLAAERRLADAGLDDARLLDAELDAAGLELAHRLGDVVGHGADLRVRHQALGAEHAAEPADQTHHVGRRDHRVEVGPVLLLDLLDQVLGADGVRAGGPGLVRLVALGDDDDALALAGAVRQHDRAAHHLVGVLGVDAQADGDVDALVELRHLRLGDELARLVDRIALARGRPWRTRS